MSHPTQEFPASFLAKRLNDITSHRWLAWSVLRCGIPNAQCHRPARSPLVPVVSVWLTDEAPYYRDVARTGPKRGGGGVLTSIWTFHVDQPRNQGGNTLNLGILRGPPQSQGGA